MLILYDNFPGKFSEVGFTPDDINTGSKLVLKENDLKTFGIVDG